MGLRIVAFLMSFSFALPAAPADEDKRGTERFDFKGIPFGASQKEFQQLFPMAGWCGPSRDKRMADVTCGAARDNIKCDVRGAPKTCAEDRDKAYIYAGVRMRSFNAFFYSDALSSMHVTFSSTDFDSVLDAVTTRYGKPNHIKSEPPTAAVPYENAVASWRKGDSVLELRKYAGGVEVGSAMYVLDSSRAEFERRRTEASKKDL
jgi:hypothetical protein